MKYISSKNQWIRSKIQNFKEIKIKIIYKFSSTKLTNIK